MKSVIRFTRVRRAMYALSLLCIVGGFAVTVIRGGFNWSVDFTGGVSKDLQVAPRALTLRYEGAGRALVSLAGDVLSLRLALPGQDEKNLEFPLRNYPRIGDVAAALRMIDGVSVEAAQGIDGQASSLLLPLSFPADLSGQGAPLNRVLSETEQPQASIDAVRGALRELGDFSLQTVGRPRDQAFVVKLAAVREEGSTEYLARVDRVLSERLSARFPGSDVLLRQTSFVGAMFSADLVRAAFWSILVALILIMIYASVRFKFVYAAAAVLALVHDASFMVAYVGALGIEFTAATVAALLTIIGYSINDTIVVFDRVRENFGLMPHADRALVIDTSVSQTLGRTIITNLTAQIAVLTIFIIGTGTIRDFAIVMTIGMVVGTYSSIFIAAPLVLGWQDFVDRRRRAREGGVKTSRAPLPSSEAGRA
jgi:preprotein translocase subunit SecF